MKIAIYNNVALRLIKPRWTGIIFAAAFTILILTKTASAATAVSQFGFTWTFSSDRTVGQYCNGDWWVVGPVTINSISPACVTSNGWTRNGTMVNPPTGCTQGFDSSIIYTGAQWSSSMNLSPNYTGSPLVVTTGSVVSTVSRPTQGVSGVRPQLSDGAVLTVVASAPAAGAFRPPIMGNDKNSYWTKSQLNYGILKTLAPVASTPTLATVESYYERPWFAQMEGSPARYIAPLNNMPEYGRDQAQMLSYGLLSLHLDYSNTQKEKLFIRLTQYGIDIYGSVKAGTVYPDLGGLNPGRKAPLVLAALALNDSNMKVIADGDKNFVFHEDRQTWFVTQSDVGRAVYQEALKPRETYRQEHVGMAEWGEQHTKQPNRDDSRWEAYYRHTNGGPLLGHALMAIMIPGGRSAWNWEPFFFYCDRFWSEEKNGQFSTAPNNINPFVYNMWQAYRNGNDDTTPPVVVNFSIGDRIATTRNTNVRNTATLASTLLGVQTTGSVGKIVAGPVVMDGITWWQINYDTGADGWSGGDNFIKSASQPTPPAPPEGLRVVPP